MKYLTIEHCRGRLLFTIAKEFDKSEKTPDYESNIKGIENLNGVFERMQWNDLYKNFFEKAAYLFVSITKNHFFINGNKRLALILLLEFCYENDWIHKRVTRNEYKRWFKNNFPKYKIPHRASSFYRVYGWAFYNLNKAISSDVSLSFGSMKKKVEIFLRFALAKE